MTGLVPLFLLYLAANRSPFNAAPALTSHSGAPPWPTPNSPPPMPAFDAMVPTASADPSHSSTPLADLHNHPPNLAPASSTQPASVKKAAHLATPQSVKQAAIAAFKKKSTSLLKQKLAKQQAASTASLSSLLRSATSSATTVPVVNLQKILISRGVKIKPDGLYGPKTADGWSKLAASKSLPTTIARVSAKTAKVVTHTYDTLSTPAIP